MMQETNSTRRFVFLDRDGVINVERGVYTTTIDQWQWIPGALEGIKRLADAGFSIIVITNQACIAKGIQTEEGLAILHEFMLDHIRKIGGDILRIYHCPHRDSDNCNCRKPKPGMLLGAAEDFGINLAETFLIGDSGRDIEAGRNAGTRTILVDGYRADADNTLNEPADFRADNLLEATEIVIREILLEKR
ncbi:MAG: HAD family hydrolase [Candidatus Latescibacteria bacterium]|jgi:D-glycero-D-manno-heptose 1,7-bisphosphate phosphatase|nr:HAD family hydrolase [Candidatus Latescibacterota bacterium]